RALATLDAELGGASDDLRRQIEDRRDRVLRLLNDEADHRQRQDSVREFLASRDDVLFHVIGVTYSDQAANRAEICLKGAAALKQLGLKADTPPAKAGAILEAFRPHLLPQQDFDRLVAGCIQVLFAWADAEAEPPSAEPGARTVGVRQALRLLELAAGLAR